MGNSTKSLWLIDGYNVLRVSLAAGREDREGRDEPPPWWTADRRDALLELAARLPEPRAEVWVVFDGKHLTEPQTRALARSQGEPLSQKRNGPAAVGCVFAASADEWILRTLKAHVATHGAPDAKPAHAARAFVVTADRPLASRSRHLGAEIVSTGHFVERCGGDRRETAT